MRVLTDPTSLDSSFLLPPIQETMNTEVSKLISGICSVYVEKFVDVLLEREWLSSTLNKEEVLKLWSEEIVKEKFAKLQASSSSDNNILRPSSKTTKAGKKGKHTKRSGYLEFCKEQRKKAKAEGSELSFGEMSRIIGQKWRDLSEEEKEKYKIQSQVTTDVVSVPTTTTIEEYEPKKTAPLPSIWDTTQREEEDDFEENGDGEGTLHEEENDATFLSLQSHHIPSFPVQTVVATTTTTSSSTNMEGDPPLSSWTEETQEEIETVSRTNDADIIMDMLKMQNTNQLKKTCLDVGCVPSRKKADTIDRIIKKLQENGFMKQFINLHHPTNQGDSTTNMTASTDDLVAPSFSVCESYL